jgi:hypothetical protein
MIANEKIARRKLFLLQLAEDLANVSRVCMLMDYSPSNSTRSGATTRPTPKGGTTGCRREGRT